MSGPQFFEHDKTIFREMMAHPALFTHPNPKKITIIGDEDRGILHEVLKHAAISEIYHLQKNHVLIQDKDARVRYFFNEDTEWMGELKKSTIDILIHADNNPKADLKPYYDILNPQGILILPSESPFQLRHLKSLADHLSATGFSDLQILHFPQPQYMSGWRSTLMAVKNGRLSRVREKAIYNRSFTTQYYNFDTHKAALALPEFIRKEWIA